MNENGIDNIINTLLNNINMSTHNIFCIYGGIKSGKTYLLKRLRYKLYEEGYAILFLTNDDIISLGEYSIFHSAINEVNIFNRLTKEGVTSFFSFFSDSVGNFAKLMLNLDENMLSHIFFSLNSVELEIIKRIYSICEKHSLVILADNIDKWEEKSIELFIKIIELKYKSNISAFNDLFFITTQTTDKNHLNYEQAICINIENISFKDFQSKILHTNLAELSNEEQYNLYNLTEGNYGIIEDLINFSDSIITNEVYSNKNNNSEFEALIKSILKRKLETIDEDKKLSFSLGCASIIGKIFDERLLRYLMQKNIYEIKIILNIAKNEHFLYEKNGIWKFTADYIYDYFLENTIEDRVKIHYQLAEILKQYVPSDLYNRYHHLKKSEQREQAIDVLTVYCIRSIIDLKYFNERYIDEISINSGNIDILYSIKKAFNIINEEDDYITARNIVGATDNYVNDFVIVERDYVLAFILYHCNDSVDFSEAESTLNRIFQDTSVDLYQWARCATLLFLIYANRLNDHNKAKETEKQIIYRLSKNDKIDQKLKMLSSIIQRVSPSLYNTDVSYLKTMKSYMFFKDNKNIYPKEYVMAATNHIAMCICSSKYAEAVNISESTMQYITETFTYDFPKLFKFLNNCVLAKYFSNILTERECCEEIEKICKLKESFSNNMLLQNNKAVFMSTDNIKTAFEIIKNLYITNKRNEHNDYYTYLFSINYMLLLILNNNYDEADRVFTELNYMIPTICSNDKSLIIQRYDAFRIIIDKKRRILHILN